MAAAVYESGGAKSRLVCAAGVSVFGIRVPASDGRWTWSGGGRPEVQTEGWWPPLLGGVNYCKQAFGAFWFLFLFFWVFFVFLSFFGLIRDARKELQRSRSNSSDIKLM